MLRSLWCRLAPSRPRNNLRGKRPRLALEPLEARALLSATIFTVAGVGTEGFSGDGGHASKAQLDQPSGVAVDNKGNLYIVDDYNERVRKVSATGIISTLAGNGITGDSGDGGLAKYAEFQFGSGGGVATDSKGDVFIACPTKSRVREVLPNGHIRDFAGSFDNQGNSGDGGPATRAALNYPFAVAVDKKGDVFICDSGNNDVREVTPDGIIHTVAGNGQQGFSGDGGLASHAELNQPSDIAVDPRGNLYILDSGNNRVREVLTSGKIRTIAGNGQMGFSGDGGVATRARLNFAMEGGLAVDARGDVFIADSGNNRIREVTHFGRIKTIAGTGAAGYSGDDGSPLHAQLNNPTGVVLDSRGDLFIADTFNSRVREIPGATAL
jgi:sugar lactone lactonase YvrE